MRVMSQPSRHARSLRRVDILARFDAKQRLARGRGASFDPQEWPDNPDPDLAEVKAGLRRPQEALSAHLDAVYNGN
jgi:hypothetical protein